VSIVTTVYDRSECLRQCIRSVKRLAFENLEQIIVADAPPPAALAAIEQVAAEEGDGRLHVLNLAERSNNWGITPAAVGLRQATGDFVCFLSDDNGYTPDHLTHLLAAFNRDPRIGFAYSSCAYAGRLVLRHPVPCGGRIDLGQPMFRRELFSTYLDDDLPFNQFAWDWALIAALIKHGVKWQHVDKPTFIFRLAQYPRLMPK
jgi:glycosyltransferase involved in cell wall biosynthesis